MNGKYISLITYKKNDDPIATPVWFVERDENIYFSSAKNAYKLKRIKNNPNVKIAPCSTRGKVKGSYIDGSAVILSDNESNAIFDLFKKKYLLAK